MTASRTTLGGRAAATLVGALLPRTTAVFVSPGSRNTPLALAFDAHERADVHVVLDERAAGFMALGAARSTGAPAIVVCTSGSAGAHYLPAIVEARHARAPLIAVTADRPAELQHVGAHQTLDQTRLFGEQVLATFALPVCDAELPLGWIAQLGARAWARSSGSPPGPVHINMPFREPLWVEADHQDDSPHPGAPCIETGSMMLAGARLDALAGEMRSAQRGVIVCGPLAPATQDERALAVAVSRLASTLRWPLLADPSSGLRFGSHDRSTLICSYDALLRHEPFSADHDADMVLRLGRIPTSKALGEWLARRREAVTLLDPDGEWHDPTCSAARLLVADATATCAALADQLETGSSAARDWLDGWRRADELAASIARTRDDLWEGSLARAVVQQMPNGSQLHLGSSMPIRDVDGFGGTHGRSVRVHANRGTNGIDGTIASAVGEALAWPHGPSLALLGDLTFLHDLDGLAAAAQLAAADRLPRGLTLVVVDNGGGGIFEHLPIRQHADAFERLFLTPQRADLAPLCQAFGIPHRRVDNLAEASAAVAERLEQAGLGVVQVIVDRDASVSTHREVWAQVAIQLAAARLKDAP